MLVATETSPRYLHAKTPAPVTVQRIRDVNSTRLLKARPCAGGMQRTGSTNCVIQKNKFLLIFPPPLFQVRCNSFHFLILWIRAKRSQRPRQPRSPYPDFLLQGTSSISQLSFYALLPFHPDYKLLQGPGAIQLCTPFKSGFKEKAPHSRCFNQVNTQAQRATAPQLTTFPFVWQIQRFSAANSPSDAPMLSVAISILNVTPN